MKKLKTAFLISLLLPAAIAVLLATDKTIRIRAVAVARRLTNRLIPGEVSPPGTAPHISVGSEAIIVENKHFRYRISFLNPQKQFCFGEITNKAVGDNIIKHPSDNKLFVIRIGDSQVDSRDFRISGIKTTTTKKKNSASLVLSLSPVSKSLAISAELRIEIDDSPEAKWFFKVTNKDEKKAITAHVSFPVIGGIQVGDSIANNYYLYPVKGAGSPNSNMPIDYMHSYGSSAFIQLMAAYNPRTNGGIYAIAADSKGIDKFLYLRKANGTGEKEDSHNWHSVRPYIHGKVPRKSIFDFPSGVGMAYIYVDCKLKAGQSFSPPMAIVGIYKGKWREPLISYKSWLKSWFSFREVPKWLRYSFSFGSWALNKRKSFMGLEEFGDITHLMVWRLSKSDAWGKKARARPWNAFAHGLFEYTDGWGGKTGLRKVIENIHKAGSRVWVYMDGFLLGKYNTPIGRKWGAKWAMLAPKGEVYQGLDYYSPTPKEMAREEIYEQNWPMCPQSAWQDYLVTSVGKLVRDMGVDIVYFDSWGSRWAERCYSSAHRHDGSGVWVPGILETLRRTKEKAVRINPTFALAMEEPGADLFRQYVDAAWTYAFATGHHEIWWTNPSGIHLDRFIFPEFKYIMRVEKGADLPQALFNGVAIYPLFSPTKTLIKKTKDIISVMKENGDAFSSTDVVALIDTRDEDIMANKFAADGKTIYTIYNNSADSKAGYLLKADLPDGYHFVDLLNHREVRYRKDGKGKAELFLQIKPRQATAIARVAGLIDIDVPKSSVAIRAAEQKKGFRLRITRTGQGEKKSQKELRLDGSPLTVNIKDVFTSKKGRAILQLFNKKGFLVDEAIYED